MMTEKLTYEEWRARMNVTITHEAITDLKKYHNIDAVAETEKALRKEYEFYLNGGFDERTN